MNSKKRPSVLLRVSWALSAVLALALFLPGLLLQADKYSQGGVLGIWMTSSAGRARIVAIAPGLSAERAGLRTGDVILSRSEHYDQTTHRWAYDVTYQDQIGAVHHVIIETNPPQRLPFNLPAPFFGWTSAFLDLVFFLSFLLVGTLIVWQSRHENNRSARQFASVAAFALLITGIRVLPEIYLTLGRFAGGSQVGLLMLTLGYIIFPLFLSLFPNGRWVPRGIWIYVLASGLYGCANLLFGWRPFANNQFNILVDLAITGIGVAVQVYRYLRASTGQERQQTKWALAGIGSAFVLYYLFQLADSMRLVLKLFPTLSQNGSASYLYIIFWSQLLNLALLLVPISLAISILRFRLWDIDLIIRRTLAYTLVTSLLVGIYFAMVVALQQIFRLLTGQSSTLAIILSTLAISLLFVPVRQRVQAVIDRRFYRRQYSTAQTLEQFSNVLRSEMNLDCLSDELVEVISETLHPEPVSLWIIPIRRDSE